MNENGNNRVNCEYTIGCICSFFYKKSKKNEKNTNLEQLFSYICEIKRNMLKLNSKQLKNFKILFYNQKISTWKLDLMWEYLWNDTDFETVNSIIFRKKEEKK